MSENKYGEPWYAGINYMDTCDGIAVAEIHDDELAFRAVACVNALAGVEDPAAYITGLRERFNVAKMRELLDGRSYPAFIDHLGDEIERLNGLSEWHAIDKAPLDGTLVRVFGHNSEGHSYEAKAAFIVDKWVSNDIDEFLTPTHYMLLPNDPK